MTQRIAPELAADWPEYRDLEATIGGARERRENISAVWSWLGSYELARDDAAALFEPAELAAVAILHEHTAEQLNALLGTISFWSKLSPAQREAIEGENRSLQQRLGRPIRTSTVACLVTARRADR